MKMMSKLSLGLLAVGLLAAPARGQDPLLGLYIKADAGGAWTRDAHLREFFGEVTPGSRLEFDPGPRFGMTVGYDLCEWFGVEGQIGIMENEISRITDAQELDARLINVPFLVNGRIHLPTYFKVSPYVGAGVGGASTILDSGRITINDISLEGSDTDTVFAWQAFAGLRIALNQHMGLSFEYRYFQSDGARYRADFAFGTDTDVVRLGRINTQTVSVAFDWTF